MARLIYTAITSLDGYIEDAGGKFDWAEPDREVHEFVNELEREIGTYLYGRRMYEVMSPWESIDLDGQPGFIQDYAKIWRAADKVVYSKTLAKASTARTRIERDFDAAAVRRLKSEGSGEVSIGGPELAAHAIRAGLVDEYRQFVVPVLVGGGKHWLPQGFFVRLDLVAERTFADGVVFLRYKSVG